MDKVRVFLKYGYSWLAQHKHHVAAGLLILLWCLPYFTSGDRIEWGDFDFFVQGYEAIRISILEYGQFPWWNPWIAGGIPLYANPQLGVFSIQTPLVLLLGAPLGLKLAVVLYTVAGYASMFLLLRCYFKTKAGLAALLSLVWIFSSFFVAHIPSHYTFVWYLLAPLLVYIALTVKDWRGGLWLGGIFAVMALGAVHYAFFHIAIVVGGILAVRLVIERARWRTMVGALAAAAGIFVVLAGHRILFAVQNVRDHPRALIDPAAEPFVSVLAIFLPYPRAQSLPFINIKFPQAPFGFGEATSTIGIFATLAALLCIAFILFSLRGKLKAKLHALSSNWLPAVAVLGLALLFFAIGLGSIHPLAPYSLLENLPLFGQMRVSTRWFIWVSLALLVFTAIVVGRTPKGSRFRIAVYALLVLGVAELFLMNVGYQHKHYFRHDVIKPDKATAEHAFAQTTMFGSAKSLPDGVVVPDDGKLPRFYREYEATLFNTGVISANEPLLFRLDPHQIPLCGWEDGCGLVLSGNARVTYWSPHKIVLERTDEGPVRLNMNNSSYFTINGQRSSAVRVAEPFEAFIIDDPSHTITVQAAPSALKALPGIP